MPSFTKTLVPVYQTTRRNIPQDYSPRSGSSIQHSNCTCRPKFIIIRIAHLSFEFFLNLFTLALFKAVLFVCAGVNVGCSLALFKAVLFVCAGVNVDCSLALFKAVLFVCAGVNVGCSCVCIHASFTCHCTNPDEGDCNTRRNVRIATTSDTGVRNCASRRRVHARTHTQFPLRDTLYQTRLRSDSFGAGEVCRLRNSTLGRYEHTNLKKMYGGTTVPV